MEKNKRSRKMLNNGEEEEKKGRRENRIKHKLSTTHNTHKILSMNMIYVN
jgi:hypothetical protein